MNINTRNMSFVKFNNEEMQWVKVNGVTVYEAWKELMAQGSTPLVLTKSKGTDLIDYKIFGNSTHKSILPNEYQQVEYIEGTGTQYFTIDYIASNTTNAKGKFQITVPEQVGFLFGSRVSASAQFYGFNWGGGIPYKYYNSFYAGVASSVVADTDIHTFRKEKEKLYIDDELIHAVSVHENRTFVTPFNMCIFACNQNGAQGYIPSRIRLFDLQFYDNDQLKVDLIPCYRKADNEIGAYDLVSNTFYSNQGTDTFLKGVDVPTPETPVEIVSVGEKTKNIVDLSKVTLSQSTEHVEFDYDNTTGTIELTSEPQRYDYSRIQISDLGVELEVGKTYYVGAKITVTGKQTADRTSASFGLVGAEETSTQYQFYENGTQEAKLTYTYTGKDEMKLVLNYNYGSVEPAKTKFENVYISEVDEFEPFGYKIPIVINNNLFKLLTLEQGSVIDATGVLADSESRVRTNLFALEAGTYNISMNWNLQKCMIKGIHVYNYDTEEWIKYISGGTSSLNVALDGKSKIRIVFNKSASAGETITPEEVLKSDVIIRQSDDTFIEEYVNIYLSEPLRKVGDYADYIDFENQKIIRNTKSGTLTTNGTSNVGGTSDDVARFYYTKFSDRKISTDNEISVLATGLASLSYSDYSKSNFSDLQSITGGTGNVAVFFKISKALIGGDTVEACKAYLTANPITVYYILATPTEELIELPNIPTLKGTTIIEVNTKIQPNNIQVVYLGKK